MKSVMPLMDFAQSIHYTTKGCINMAFFRGDIFSNQLGMNTGIHVIIPNNANNSKLNVVYLLHGLSDNCSSWVQNTGISLYAERYGVAVIIPEVQRSFYTDMKYGMNYFSYVSNELIQFVHNMFGLSNKREQTYVAGLSMGGFGAMKCALTKPEQYVACAAFSAVCDLKGFFPGQIKIEDVLDIYAAFGIDFEVGEGDNLFALSTKCANGKPGLIPNLYMACGKSDGLYQQNLELRDHIQTLKFDYDYEEWEGGHDWIFWDTAIQATFKKWFGVKQ